MALPTCVEYQAFKALYSKLQNGIQTSLPDVASETFSASLLPPHVKGVTAITMLPEDSRAQFLLDSLLNRTQNVPETFDKFAEIMEKIPSFKYLAVDMREKRDKLREDEKKRIEEHEKQAWLRSQMIQDLQLPMKSSRKAVIITPEYATPTYATQRRVGDDQFPGISTPVSFEHSPMMFRERISVSSTPGMIPMFTPSVPTKNIPLYSANKAFVEVFDQARIEPPATYIVQSQLNTTLNPNPSTPHGDTPSGSYPPSAQVTNKCLSEGSVVASDNLETGSMVISAKGGGNLAAADALTCYGEGQQSNKAKPSPTEHPIELTLSTGLGPIDKNENVDSPEPPSVKTIAPTPMTSLPPSASVPLSDPGNDKRSKIVALRPERSISNMSVESSVSSTCSEDYESALTSLTDSESSQEMVIPTPSRRLNRLSSCERCLKKELEEGAKKYAELEVKMKNQEATNQAQVETLLKEIKLKKDESFERKHALQQFSETNEWLGRENYNLHQQMDVLKMEHRRMSEELKEVKGFACDQAMALKREQSKTHVCCVCQTAISFPSHDQHLAFM